jgi:hypothetical protein
LQHIEQSSIDAIVFKNKGGWNVSSVMVAIYIVQPITAKWRMHSRRLIIAYTAVTGSLLPTCIVFQIDPDAADDVIAGTERIEKQPRPAISREPSAAVHHKRASDVIFSVP